MNGTGGALLSQSMPSSSNMWLSNLELLDWEALAVRLSLGSAPDATLPQRNVIAGADSKAKAAVSTAWRSSVVTASRSATVERLEHTSGAGFGMRGTSALQNQRVRVGAIRWDAWGGRSAGQSQAQQAECSSPEVWRARVPACGFVEARDRVDFACDTKRQIRKELEQASTSGINYWAFVLCARSHAPARAPARPHSRARARTTRCSRRCNLPQWNVCPRLQSIMRCGCR